MAEFTARSGAVPATGLHADAVLALGAWLKNTACLLPLSPGKPPRWSALHGDLGDPQACAALQASVQALVDGARPQAVAHDLHPDFFSTRLAQQLAVHWGVPAIVVQHHQAHIAAVLAEHALTRPGLDDQPVIGLALDGFGLGPAGQAWGGELLWLHGARWQRLGGLWPLALPGGDAAAREPWRMAAAALQALGQGGAIVPRCTPLVGGARAQGVAQMLSQGLNCPPTSSAGRWFDAAAGALGLGAGGGDLPPGAGDGALRPDAEDGALRRVAARQAHEAEAAITLEQAAQRALAQAPADALAPAAGQVAVAPNGDLDTRPLLADLLALPQPAAGALIDQAAARFHLGLADGLAAWAAQAAHTRGLATVVLGGGCLANRVLTQRLVAQLEQHHGLRVLQPQALSCGDAGLALGQAWVAAQTLRAATTDRHQDHPLETTPCV